jgi:hypothetical protein
MDTAQGQGNLQRPEQDAELLEEFARQHLAKVLADKREAKFSGSVAIKFELKAGVVRQVHIDDHNLVTGPMLRGSKDG